MDLRRIENWSWKGAKYSFIVFLVGTIVCFGFLSIVQIQSVDILLLIMEMEPIVKVAHTAFLAMIAMVVGGISVVGFGMIWSITWLFPLVLNNE